MRAASMKVAGGVVAMAAILAACSGGGDSGGDASDAPTGPAPPPEPAGAEAAADPRSDAERKADQEAAEAALLTIDDFDAFAAFEEPWEAVEAADEAEGGEDTTTAAGDEGGGNDDGAGGEANDEAAEDDETSGGTILDQVATCLGLQGGLLGGDNPEATSPTFRSPDSVLAPLVSAQVTYTASDEDVARGLEILRRDQAPECLETVIDESLLAPGEDPPPDLEFRQTTAEEIAVAELGDEVLALRAVTPVVPVNNTGPLEDQAVDVFAELRIVRLGRVGVTMFFQNQLAEFPRDEAQRITRAVVDRIPADGAGAGQEAAPANR